MQEPAKGRRRARGALVAADSIIRHEAGGAARRRSRAWQLAGRVPVGSYPVDAVATPRYRTLGGSRRRGSASGPTRTGATRCAQRLRRPPQQLPVPAIDRARGERHPPLPDELAAAPDDAARGAAARPSNTEAAPAGTPIRPGGPIQHVFYIVRENRTYDQILGDDSRGDGDPRLTLFGEDVTPERARAGQALPAARPRVRELGGVDRRPLLDGGGLGVRLRRQELAPELRRPRAARTTSASTR